MTTVQRFSTDRKVRRFPGLLLGLCLVIFASKVVWYDLRIVFPTLRGNVFRMLLTGQALALLPFIFLGMTQGLGSVRRSWTVCSYLFMIVLGTVVAVLQGIDYPAFVAQDVIKLLFVPAAFGLIWFDPPRSLGSFLLKIADIVFAFQVVKVFCFLLLYHGRMGLYYGGVMDTFPFCVYAARYCTKVSGSTMRDGILAGASMLILVAGQKRTLFAIIAAVGVYLMLRNVNRVLQKPSMYLGGLVFMAGAALFSGTILEIVEARLARVIVKTVETDNMIENSARLREISIIDYEMDLSDSLTHIFGFGHGASFDDDIGDEVTGETLTHSVHFTPYAMYLRYGYVGWGFFAIMVLGTFFAKERWDGQWSHREDILAIKSFGIAAILSSGAIYGLMDDMFLGFGLGALAISAKLADRPRFEISAPEQAVESAEPRPQRAMAA